VLSARARSVEMCFKMSLIDQVGNDMETGKESSMKGNLFIMLQYFALYFTFAIFASAYSFVNKRPQ